MAIAEGLDANERNKASVNGNVLDVEGTWWTLGDLNPRPPGCKPGALPS